MIATSDLCLVKLLYKSLSQEVKGEIYKKKKEEFTIADPTTFRSIQAI